MRKTPGHSSTMETVSNCDLGDENLDFILGIVDICGVDDDSNNDNDFLMTMEEEGDDDVFENVLINNSCNFCQNSANKSHVCDNGHNHNNNACPMSSFSNNFMDHSLLIRNCENKENSGIPLLHVDRNNNNSVSNTLIINNNSNNTNASVHNNQSIIGRSTNVSSPSCAYNSDDVHNSHSPKVYHDLQNSRVVAMATTTNNNSNNDYTNNANIEWSNLGDFNYRIHSNPLPPCSSHYGSINYGDKQNIDKDDGSSSNDNNNNNNHHHHHLHPHLPNITIDDTQTFLWSQRQFHDNNSSSISCCSSNSRSSLSRTASSSSSIGSSNSSSNICGNNNNSNNNNNNSSGSIHDTLSLSGSISGSIHDTSGSISGSIHDTSGSISGSIHDTSGSSSSRNSSCSSISGAFVSATTTSTITSTSTTTTTTPTTTPSTRRKNEKNARNRGKGSCTNSSSSSSSGKNSSSSSCSSSSSSSNDSGSNEGMMSAYMEACRSGQLTPILKEELKFFIQARRLSQGKEEMEVQFTPPSPSQLSVKEVEKIERRKKQNRQAAKRFRQKQKSCEDLLLQKIKELEGTNTTLFEEAQVLRGEKQKLMEVIAEHLLVCPFFSLKSPILSDMEPAAAATNINSVGAVE